MTDKKKQLTLPTWADQAEKSDKNKFQVLGTIPKTTYSSALATLPKPSNDIMNDPFRSKQTIQPSQPNSQTHAPTQYMLKPATLNLFSVEPVHKHTHDPIELVKVFFPPGCHFIPAHPDKTLAFYNDILMHHQSITIKPITDKRDSSKVIYHSIYIHNIVNLDEWGHPSLLRTLPDHPIQYNYYDYIESWFKVLLYETDKFSHSWFIQFDHKFKSVIPSWFARWWHQYGAIPDIIPAQLLDQVNLFSTAYKVNQHTSQFLVLLLFMIKYKVPWIVKWRYQLLNNIVSRQYLVKWWGQYNHQKIVNQVQLEFPAKIPIPAQNPVQPIEAASP
ncbi:hypothetical protein RHMOL_Rhmol04G0135200 [Rhododendron molle]|uniref:Uncharacterized protein n=1 Tax=Rhododendron molle TaxID=49168 RepID=A0ACC0P1N4_RHOML|nr:hypothetical protein RHMOL_Rhmol04G0135200 [Rhododendron molle]